MDNLSSSTENFDLEMDCKNKHTKYNIGRCPEATWK